MVLTARRWSRYHPHYRAPQMVLVAPWLANGASCAVIGMAGCGKSNFLGFLSRTPHALAPYLGELAEKIIPIPVDLNSLPTNTLDTFFRLLLRSFFEMKHQFDEETQALISQQYLENHAATDPFLPQSGLRTLLFHFEAREMRIVLVMDRFDRFTERAVPGMTDTLRSLRDSFKDSLCFVVGMRQAPKYLLNPETLGELYEILDLHICWVGPMALADSQRVIAEELLIAEEKLEPDLVKQIYALTGGYPSLLKAVCQRYVDDGFALEQWQTLLTNENVTYRLAEIWQGLTQQEQMILFSLASGEACTSAELRTLQMKGLLLQDGDSWRIGSTLLQGYVTAVGKLSRGMIWEEDETGVLYQGKRPLDNLPPTEAALLTFFIRNPYKRHTYTEIITAVWTEEENIEGVTDQALAKQVSNLRKRKIAPDRSLEPNPAKPIYIINYRAKPEGGYQFFPEGKPS
ncbi:MAG: winged helix-turn-helix domain-containing protein [Anaerolineales bacterium]|nr:winged helix-turn-helix domain-containing protein [Anaerolineales bacterium]